MGGVCAGGVKKNVNAQPAQVKSSRFSGKLAKPHKSSSAKELENSSSIPNGGKLNKKKNKKQKKMTTTMMHPGRDYSGELLLSVSRELKPSKPAGEGALAKVNHKTSFLGKAGTMGLEKTLEVLDTLGSSMSNLNARSGFISGMPSRGNRISILAFEVANTISKGANLFQSLSEENVNFLKKEILHSEGVKQLVSTDMKELLAIAASDKREEFDVFSREVIRFGDLCKDPQWHNLGRYFPRLDAELSTDKQTREEAEMTVLELTTLVQHTSVRSRDTFVVIPLFYFDLHVTQELYHELHSLDRFEQDYQRKVEELQSLHLPQKGDSLSMLQSELKEQRKLVRSLKKRSLWSKSLEEIMEKLVDIVTYLHQAILEAFGSSGISVVVDEPANHQKLGKAGLALHYANMITQIDNIASRPTSLPPNTRDSLYRGLPPSVKTSLRSRLQMFDDKEELTITQVKAEMEKTMHWLVPIAANTTKAHQGFGWVGEWASTGSDYGKTNTAAQGNLIRLQTLYHADKEKTDQNILEAVAWLHRLIKLVRQRDNGLRTGGLTLKSATYRGQDLHSKMQQQQQFVLLNQTRKPHVPLLSEEDRDLLNKVSRKRLIPGISKSQEFSRANKSGRGWASLSRNKSTGTSPAKEIGRRRKMVHQPRANLLDILDGLHSM
ncbi:Protein PSK SIMULATOR 2 [Linum perenne]